RKLVEPRCSAGDNSRQERPTRYPPSGEDVMSFSPSATPQPSALISRRRLLQAGGLGALHLALPGMVAARVDGGRAPRGHAAEKSCIFLLLCGGPSHLDTWDLKPDAPEGIRGPYRPVATAVPGMRLSELHPRLARLSKDFCLI